MTAPDPFAPPCVLVEDGPGGAPAFFARPEAIVRADRAEEVPAALDALEAARERGRWIAGLLSYELGYALEPRLAPLMPPPEAGGRGVPLILVGVFGPPSAPPPLPAGAVTLAPPIPLWSEADHAKAMARVLAWIAAGDIYQANLTFPMESRWSGHPAALLAALRRAQAVRHGALVAMPGAPVILSRSPELFFAISADGTIETRPMKGTAPRAPDPAEDAALKAALGSSVKNRAENLMIVDLLRNDISRICRAGSVRVPDLFRVETYATVHQMISRVTGRLADGVTFPALLSALFPCGSVTGAPKIRAMEIIRALEPWPRGAYCGAVGWMGPRPSGGSGAAAGEGRFNVAIRTLTLYPDGLARLAVGGGVVHDSTAAGEYQEALWKARFARPA
jgi:para-aminobenzoate synthetase component 1